MAIEQIATGPLASETDGTQARTERANRSHGDLATLASGWVLNLVGVAVWSVSGFAFILMVARALGPHDAGVFFAATALFAMVTTVAGFGSGVGVVRMFSAFRATQRSHDVPTTLAAALVPPLAVALLIAAVVLVFAPQLSHLLLGGAHSGAATPYLRALAPFIPLAVVWDVVVSGTRGLGSLLPNTAIGQVWAGLARVVFTAFVLGLGGGAVALAVASQLPVALGAVAVALILARMLSRIAPDQWRRGALALPSRDALSEFWRFAGPLGVASILQIALLWLDTILLAAMASPTEAGVYRTASSFIMHGTFAQSAIVLVMGPIIGSLLARHERERARSVYETATWWITGVGWPIYLTLAVFAPLFMGWLGHGFAPGATPLRILALAMIVAVSAGPVSATLVMSGRSSWNLANVAIAVVLNIALNLLLIPRYGMTGAAIAWAVSILVNNLAPLAQVWHFVGISPLGRGFAVVAAGAATLYGVAGLATWESFGRSVPALAVYATAATAVYAAYLWRFRSTLRLSFLKQSIRARRLGVRVEPSW